jgi:ATP-dependent Clp protease ATP-binding subunit ClpC
MDAANILKPALARGQMQIIGATTISEYRKYIEKDAALERRLQPLMIKEPTIEQTIQIFQAVISTYERHHNVRYTAGAITAAAQLSERYITDRFLPDKAFDLLDEDGAITELEYLEQYENYDGFDTDTDGNRGDGEDTKSVVTEQAVVEIMSEWSGIPIGKIEANEMDRLLNLEKGIATTSEGSESGYMRCCTCDTTCIEDEATGVEL